MATIAETRQQYPQYKDLSDQQLAEGLYNKFYSDMPKDQYFAKLGVAQNMNQLWGDNPAPNTVSNQPTTLAPEINRLLAQEAQSPDQKNARTARVEQHIRNAEAVDQLQNQRLPTTPDAILSKVLPRQAVEQGISFGLSDELSAGIKALIGQGKYDELLQAERERLDRTRKDRPVASIAGEGVGAIATAPFVPVAAPFRGANIASRAANAAINGGILGGVYGFNAGENGAENRLQNASSGAITGAVTGGVGAPLVEGIAAGVNALTRPFRGVVNPEGEAQRRVFAALARDNPNTPNAANVAADMLERSNAQGVPMVIADMGGETTRALARSSANSSPPARTALNNVVNDRFETQSDRISNVVRSIVGGDPNAPALRQAVQQEARTINAPAYRQAYAQGQNLWDETLQNLAQAPDMQTAIRAATIKGNNQAAVQGAEQVRNPFMTGQDGRLSLRTNPDGSTATPNLEFWNAVKINLDQINTRESQFLSRSLRSHLDELVPSYRTARAWAAQAFGAQDALEAGQNFVSSSMPIKEARIAFQQLNNAEREMFRQGFASDLLDKIAKSGDRRNIVNSIFGSADARERLNLALGPQGAQRIEAAARLENVMDLLRTAVQGNSTTARQLAELGLAGGTGYLYSGGDLTTTGGFALAALLARRGAARIDQRVATRVAEMLSSNDPQILRNAYNMVARNQSIMAAVRRAENDLSRLAIPNAPRISTPQNVLPAAAEQDQNNSPR